MQFLKQPKPAVLLPLFGFVSVSTIMATSSVVFMHFLETGNLGSVLQLFFFWWVLIFCFGSKTKSARSPVRKAIVYLFNLKVKSIFWLFLMYVLGLCTVEYAVYKLRNIFFS